MKKFTGTQLEAERLQALEDKMYGHPTPPVPCPGLPGAAPYRRAGTGNPPLGYTMHQSAVVDAGGGSFEVVTDKLDEKLAADTKLSGAEKTELSGLVARAVDVSAEAVAEEEKP